MKPTLTLRTAPLLAPMACYARAASCRELQ